jgi:hypothetical protein
MREKKGDEETPKTGEKEQKRNAKEAKQGTDEIRKKKRDQEEERKKELVWNKNNLRSRWTKYKKTHIVIFFPILFFFSPPG